MESLGVRHLFPGTISADSEEACASCSTTYQVRSAEELPGLGWRRRKGQCREVRYKRQVAARLWGQAEGPHCQAGRRGEQGPASPLSAPGEEPRLSADRPCRLALSAPLS